jgi:uncharacterized protein (TIGR03067 family)
MRCVLPVLAVLSLAFAPVPFPKRQTADVAADLEAMQGTWVLADAHKDGVREKVTGRCLWVIKGDRVSASLDGKKGSTCFIRLDGAAKPRFIDLLNRRDDKAANNPGRYRLRGDTLTVCLGKDRPRDVSGYGPSNGVWVFKRVER